jgi:hypothetical protein
MSFFPRSLAAQQPHHGETYKNVVKMTFVTGAAKKDPSGLFNSRLEGNTRRAIDFVVPVGIAGL